MKIGTLEKRKRACRIEVHISGVRRNSSGMEFMMELINNVTKAKCTCRTQGPQCCRVPGASVKQRACSRVQVQPVWGSQNRRRVARFYFLVNILILEHRR